jgi:glucose-6-phosphate 1-dehydrogenase
MTGSEPPGAGSAHDARPDDRDGEPGGRAEIEASCAGVEAAAPAPPCTMVIFGGGGDLARTELIPAVYDLAERGLLPEPFAVVGVGRRELSDEAYRAEMRAALAGQRTVDDAVWRRVAETLHFSRGDFCSPPDADYAALRARLERLQRQRGLSGAAVFHLAAPPEYFADIAARLGAAGLADQQHGWRRLVVEKPFGVDERSARALDDALRRVFREEQIYRIDHFLGKETVQNMLVFRFANPSFEPVWNRTYIDHVQISAAEDDGIRRRGQFYDATGAVRDMVQNHLLQLLSLVAIEPPVRYDAAGLRNETVKVLEAVRAVDPPRDAVLGQYDAGTIRGAPVPGYRDEADVAPASTTATYAALRLHVDNWRWAGVPFYLRTGKRMARKLTEVVVQFRRTPHLVFPLARPPEPGVLAFRLQPDEGIVQQFAAKQPGPGLCVSPVRMRFLYAQAFGLRALPSPYAWLLLEVIEGDQTLFARSDWIARAWSVVDPVVAYAAAAPHAVCRYAAGSWGPDAAAALLTRDGHRWSVV